MARTGLAVLAVAAALLLSAGAEAKAPLAGVDVCGASGCLRLTFADAETFWVRSHNAGHAAAPARFYVIRWRWTAESAEESAYWVPAGAAVRWEDHQEGPTWGSVDAATNQRLRAIVAGIEPFAVPSPTRVTIGGREVRRPDTYLRLFRGRLVYSWPATPWLEIRIDAGAPSPWSDGRSTFRLSGLKSYVLVDHRVFKIPQDVARRARRGLALGG